MGGVENRGPHTAAYDTLWNATARQGMALPEDDFGPRMNFVGFRTAATEPTSPYDGWLEPVVPAELEPANPRAVMVDRRLGEDEPGGTGGSGARARAIRGRTTPRVDPRLKRPGPHRGRAPTPGSYGALATGSAATETETTGAPAQDGASSGCACQSAGGIGGLWLLLGFLRRRRAPLP